MKTRQINACLRSQVVLAFAYAAILMVCGCVNREPSVEGKINDDIKFVRRAYLNGRSPVFKQWGTNILSAFSSVGARTLKRPRFASATMGVDEDGEYRLIVFWIEVKSSVDAVELSLSKSSDEVVVPISAFDMKGNVNESKTSVLMAASWIWLRTNSICEQFQKVSDVSDLRVRLLARKKPATPWNPVSFYRLDHWMGSKQITQVTNGPAIFESRKD